MGEKSNSLLSIFTLGNFKVKKGDENLNQFKKKSSKRWQLLSYLITYRKRNVSREELILNLNLNDNSDPQGALSALIYRLRKILGSDQDNSEYIKTSGSAYTFNLEVNYWLDIEEVESKSEKCSKIASVNLQKSYQLYKDILNLYKGDYLEEFNSSEWIWSFRNKYKELMITTLLELDSEFKNENEELKLWQLYNKLQQKINFDERLLKNSIETLIELGRYNTARQKYDELYEIYENNDLIIPASIKKLEKKLSENQLESPENFYEDLEEDPEGAYVCEDRSLFRDIYKLERRRFKRDKIPRCFSHLRLKSDLKQGKLKRYAQKLLNILSDQLRAGDLICQWQVKHFNILLMDIKKDEATKVINRIKRYFKSKYNTEQIKINSKSYELNIN